MSKQNSNVLKWPFLATGELPKGLGVLTNSHLPSALRRNDVADKTSLKNRKRLFWPFYFYFQFQCEGNISLILVRTSVIDSMNLGDQSKSALLP